jgi:hypothetical protein
MTESHKCSTFLGRRVEPQVANVRFVAVISGAPMTGRGRIDPFVSYSPIEIASEFPGRRYVEFSRAKTRKN